MGDGCSKADTKTFEKIGKDKGSATGGCSVRKNLSSKGYGEYFFDTVPFNG
jgi:hypothetical protein